MGDAFVKSISDKNTSLQEVVRNLVWNFLNSICPGTAMNQALMDATHTTLNPASNAANMP
jgi:hypothetical protein